MRAWHLAVFTWGLLAAVSAADAQDFPYRATVAGPQAYVRSGPGRQFYPTQKLTAGEEVEVYRHDGDGWCGVRPPEGSFSWIPSRHLEIDDDGIATVIDSAAVSRAGSQFSPIHSVPQVHLDEGEAVRVLKTKTLSDGQEWCQVEPASGEFRWIALSDLRIAPAERERASSAGVSRAALQDNLSTGRVRRTGALVPWQPGRLGQRTIDPRLQQADHVVPASVTGGTAQGGNSALRQTLTPPPSPGASRSISGMVERQRSGMGNLFGNSGGNQTDRPGTVLMAPPRMAQVQPMMMGADGLPPDAMMMQGPELVAPQEQMNFDPYATAAPPYAAGYQGGMGYPMNGGIVGGMAPGGMMNGCYAPGGQMIDGCQPGNPWSYGYGGGGYSGDGSGGLAVGAEATFLKLHKGSGVAGVAVPMEFDYEISPRAYAGYQTSTGLGVRGRWWDFDHDDTARAGANTPGIPADSVDYLRVDTYVIDLEAFDTNTINDKWTMLLSGGARYIEYDESGSLTTPGPFTNVFTFERDFSGYGPTGSLELRRRIGTNWAIFANARASLVFGDQADIYRINQVAILDQTFLDQSRLIYETQMGGEWSRPLPSGAELFLRIAAEAQYWDGFSTVHSNIFLGGVPPITSGSESIGFAGFSVAAGLIR